MSTDQRPQQPHSVSVEEEDSNQQLETEDLALLRCRRDTRKVARRIERGGARGLGAFHVEVLDRGGVAGGSEKVESVPAAQAIEQGLKSKNSQSDAGSKGARAWNEY